MVRALSTFRRQLQRWQKTKEKPFSTTSQIHLHNSPISPNFTQSHSFNYPQTGHHYKPVYILPDISHHNVYIKRLTTAPTITPKPSTFDWKSISLHLPTTTCFAYERTITSSPFIEILCSLRVPLPYLIKWPISWQIS